MAEIFYFKPKVEKDAEKNLKQFIEQCKNELTVFGKDLNWGQYKWPKAANFTKLGISSSQATELNKFDDGFLDFAKAYFRYQQGHNPTQSKNELKALRAIEKALLQVNNSANIQQLSIAVLDESAKIIRSHYSVGAAYHAGKALEKLAIFVSNKNLIANNLSDWKNPIPRKKDEIQTGQKAKDRREKKLPSKEAINALAEIFFNDPEDPKDIFTSSTFAMTLCAPSRITEILELPVDCEVEEQDSKEVFRYGWRFYSGKGYEGNIKWIPTEMIPIAKEAIKRIIELTEPARKLAIWVEENPDKFYRHNNCPKFDESELLTGKEASNALGVKSSPYNHTSTNIGLQRKDYTYSLNSLWQYVMSKQPEKFPWINKEKKIKYSNALFCMTQSLLNQQKKQVLLSFGIQLIIDLMMIYLQEEK